MPSQLCPPVTVELMVKSPVTIGFVSVTGAPVALVSEKMLAPLTLCTGTDPKSRFIGVRIKPVVACPLPLRLRRYGVPPDAEVSVRVPACTPAEAGRN
jgi:hypothetical protein